MTPHCALAAPQQNAKANVPRFMRRFSIETTPGSARRIADFRNHLPEGTWVYVTSLPGSDFHGTVDTCKKLCDEGMVPVPHFTARGIANARTLDERLNLVTSEAGVTRVLAIGGADREAAGQFADTLSMLETGLFEKYKIRSIGLAGHPEDMPGLERARIREHEFRKLDFARTTSIEMYIVTQFVFEAKPVIDFVERIRSAGNGLPLVVGLPGLATIQSLIRYAKACGIGPSMHFMAKRAKDLRKLLSVQAPDKLVLDLANYCAISTNCGISGAHIYPLGGFEKSATWANAVAAGEVELNQEDLAEDDHAAASAGPDSH